MSGVGPDVRAAVLTAAQTLGVQSFPVPRVSDEDALVRVEVCGLGGSDVTLATALAMIRAGAEKVIITGRSSDAHKLEIARRWGADVVVDVSAVATRAGRRPHRARQHPRVRAGPG